MISCFYSLEMSFQLVGLLIKSTGVSNFLFTSHYYTPPSSFIPSCVILIKYKIYAFLELVTIKKHKFYTMRYSINPLIPSKMVYILSVLLLMSILAKTLFTFVCRNLMSLSLFTTRHVKNVFRLDNEVFL